MYNKRIVFLSLAIGLFWCLISAGIGHVAFAQSWLSPDWYYRNAVRVYNTGNIDSLSNYQVNIKLDSTNFDFSKAQSKGEDIRFTESDGLTLIDHWTEYWEDAAESSSVWLKIPQIPALDSIIVYIYYGNPIADDSSDGEATFEFFDDFEKDENWNTGWSVKEALPLVKAYNTAAAYNETLYVFGGYDRDTLTCIKYYRDETFSYDPSTDGWAQLADMPTARWGAIAIEFGGLIHVFAGEVATGGTAAHEVYDPATDSWSIWSDIPIELAEQGITGVKYGDKIHLFCRSYHYEYDPAADTFIAKAAVPTSRTLSTCALVDSLIYVIGGYAYGSPAGATNVNEAYNPMTDTWTTKAPMPLSRYGATRENPVINGRIYITHGLSTVFYADNYVYNPADDTWETRSAGINPRDGVGCGVISGKLYVTGGRDQLSCAFGLDYVEEYDPAADDLGGSNPWVISNNTMIKRDSLAKYQGDYGFFFDKQTLSGWESAEHYQDMVTCAVDLNWNVTDYRGIASFQPQGAILLTGNITDGALLYYNYEGAPTFRWYNGSYLELQTGMWNSWYPVTVIWDGTNSRVIIQGTEHYVSASSVNSDRVYLRVNKQTRQYFDLVRVRKYSSPEPNTIIGPADTFNHPPVLTSQDSSYSVCEDSTICFGLIVGTDSDVNDSLSLELVQGPISSCSTVVVNPVEVRGFTCFLTSGDSVYTFIYKLQDRFGAVDFDTVFIEITPPLNMLRGDANGDSSVSISDIVYIINFLFKKGPSPAVCYKSADANCNYDVSISDIVYLINSLFRGGPPPGC
ncbi:MAG: DUF2341 domain-containing protein [candidate division Zixibacteria bacterium]|nr:DUF2341 domain-containing protein [candidate division Zixibacteria bacterium]